MKINLLFLFLLSVTTAIAQQNIGIGTTSPDSSAMLDISGTNKGILIPRMPTTQRTQISSPAVGLLVFDTNTESFWFKETAGWVELRDGNVKELSDADNDTKYVLIY